MEFLIAFLIFGLILASALPYEQLATKNNLRALKGQVSADVIAETAKSNSLMEKIFKFSEKYYPMVKGMIKPQDYQKTAKMLVTAGLSDTVTPEGLLASKYVLLFGLGLYSFILAVFSSAFLIFAPVLAFVGLIYPDKVYLQSKIKSRQWKIQTELPGVLSTLAIITEAGLGLFESIEKVCEIREGEFVKELKKVNEEIRMGFIRKEAFLRMSERCEVNEVNLFVSALIQLLEKGASGITQFLRDTSKELWTKRLNLARELGAKASTKLFFPMIFLIMPATMLFLMGPPIASWLNDLFFG